MSSKRRIFRGYERKAISIAIISLFILSAFVIASVGTNVNASPEFTFSAWNEATASWATENKHSGDYSVLLSAYFDGTKDAWLYQGDRYGEEGAIVSIPCEPIALSVSTEFTFQFLMKEGIQSPRRAMLLDTGVWLVGNSHAYNTAPYWDGTKYVAPDTWQLYSTTSPDPVLAHDCESFMLWTKDPAIITALGETPIPETGGWYRPASGMHSLSYLLTKGLTGNIIEFEIRLDGVCKDPATGEYHAGTPVTCRAYVDDATINGVDYPLEPEPNIIGLLEEIEGKLDDIKAYLSGTIYPAIDAIQTKLDSWFGTGGKYSNTAQATSGSGTTTFTASGSATLYTGTKVGTVTVSFSTTGVSWGERLVVRYYTNPATPTVYIQKTVTSSTNTLGWTDTSAAWKVEIYYTWRSGTDSVNWAYSVIYPP